MRTARCIGGVAHGKIVCIEGRDIEFPIYRERSRYDVFRAVVSYKELLGPHFDRECYRLEWVRICMSTGNTGMPEWAYMEQVLVPEWMSPASITAAIKSLGYLFEDRAECYNKGL